MAVPDLDTCDLHVSIRDPNGLPFVDSVSGMTSLDMRYTSCQLDDVMYEPKQTSSSVARITFEPFTARPEGRGILGKVVEGTRVELYAHQPDCGDPVFAGFVPPGGITESGGAVTLTVVDAIERGNWQTLRRTETFNTTPAGMYTRALTWWTDLVNEDFSNPSAILTNYGSALGPWNATAVAAPSVSQGSITFAYTGPTIDRANLVSNRDVTFAVGDTYLLEIDFNLLTQAYGAAANAGVRIGFVSRSNPDFVYFLNLYETQNLSTVSTNTLFQTGSAATGGGVTNSWSTAADAVYIPLSGRFQALMSVLSPQTMVVSQSLNQQQIMAPTAQIPKGAGETWLQTWAPVVYLISWGGAPPIIGQPFITRWRVRKLTPWIARAARFNPQTTDAVYYQPNNETNLSFLQLILEKDNAEYRCRYHRWPQLDEIELDQVGTLGTDASATLGYGQPAGVPATASPQTTPFTVVDDVGSYLVTPPFRFEEGYNLSDLPAVNTKAQSYANEVIRMGSNAADAQVFANASAVADTGNPVMGVAATRPYMEVITNDDRVGLQTVAAQMTGYELTRRMDKTPSLTLKVIDSLEHAWRWRAGDKVLVKTLSLLTNVEQSMRIVRVSHVAGSAERQVVVGYVEEDPTALSILHKAALQAWSYEQSGSSPLTYVYPNVGSIAAQATSPDFTFPIDKFTGGSAVSSVTLHWYTNGVNGVDVMKVVPLIDGSAVSLSTSKEASATDSGVVDITGILWVLGTHTLAFKNNHATLATGLSSAFLTIRLKM